MAKRPLVFHFTKMISGSFTRFNMTASWSGSKSTYELKVLEEEIPLEGSHQDLECKSRVVEFALEMLKYSRETNTGSREVKRRWKADFGEKYLSIGEVVELSYKDKPTLGFFASKDHYSSFGSIVPMSPIEIVYFQKILYEMLSATNYVAIKK